VTTHSRFPLEKPLTTDDPVEGWKARVRERLAERAREKPWLKIWISSGFLALALVVGSLGGWVSLFSTLPLFASVLLAQELPRALLARAFGRVSRVALSAAGARIELSGDRLRGHSALLFAIVGSVTNLCCALLVLLGTRGRVLTEPTSLLASYALCHAAWGVAQLLPVAPFRMGEAIFRVASPGVQLALAVATALAVIRLGTFLAGLMTAPLLLAVVATILFAAVSGVVHAFRAMWDAESGVERIAAEAEACLARGEPKAANELALKGLGLARSPDKRSRLWKALAWAAIGRGDAFVAHTGLMGAEPEGIDVHLLAAYLACCNRTDEAVDLLEYAGTFGQRGPEATKLLIDLSFRRGDDEATLALVRSNQSQLSPAEREAVESAIASRTG
jgi:hypothetical protein